MTKTFNEMRDMPFTELQARMKAEDEKNRVLGFVIVVGFLVLMVFGGGYLP